MLSVLCAANIPIGCAALCILLEEKEKAEALEAYRGDLLWSVLGTLHRMAGAELNSPSCSEMLELIDKRRNSKRKVFTNEEVRKSVENTLKRFSCGK